MSEASLFGSSNQSVEHNRVLTLTKKTLRSSSSVYQLCNISSFAEGTIDMGTIPWIIVGAVFLIGLVIGIFSEGLGVFVILIAVAAAVWNFKKPKL